MRTAYVAKQCSSGNYFHYAESSASIPQGPLYYFFECFLGIFGITEYLKLLRIEIIISQLCIFLSLIIFRKYLDERILALSISCYVINPYLIVSTRNTSSHFHQEVMLILFFYLLFSRNKNKKNSFFFGLLIALLFSVYYLLFAFCIFVLILILKNTKYYTSLFFGLFSGFIINLLIYLPYLDKNIIPNFAVNNRSWGLTSYWRILIDVLSGKSIITKVSNYQDYADLVEEFQYFNFLIKLNLFLVFFLIILAVSQLYKIDFDEVNFIGLCIFILFGVFLTLADIALYPHYFFQIFFFGYFVVFRFVKNKKILEIAILIFCISSIAIFYSFSKYIQNNGGASKSDYGIVYELCGCCVEDAKTCRGQ